MKHQKVDKLSETWNPWQYQISDFENDKCTGWINFDSIEKLMKYLGIENESK